MARVSIIEPGSQHEYRLVCKGLSGPELHEIYLLLRTEFVQGEDDMVAFRNPFLPQFEPHTIHEILITIAAASAAVGRKVLDLISDIVKRKLKERDAGKRSVTIYDHQDKPHTVVEVRPKRRKKQ